MTAVKMPYPVLILLQNKNINQYRVLYGSTPNVHAKSLSRFQIIHDDLCHYMSDFGLYDIRQMIELGSYRNILCDFPKEAIVKLDDFKKYKKIHWLNTKQFKNKIMHLTAHLAEIEHDDMPEFAKSIHQMNRSFMLHKVSKGR